MWHDLNRAAGFSLRAGGVKESFLHNPSGWPTALTAYFYEPVPFPGFFIEKLPDPGRPD
ncbi:MAG: hypothetical protein IH937_15440 [Acidobacteria bacterium]|nr:hypothetical protein [Acidobacteriota bacterium]